MEENQEKNSTPEEPVIQMEPNQASTEYAGFWRRVAAHLIDSIILNIVIGLVFGIQSDPQSFNLYVPISSLVLAWIYYSWMNSSKYQATVGKMALSIIVTDMEGNRISFARSTGRFFAKILSFAILCIGVIMVAFTEKKQGLHDILAKTLVVKKTN